MYDVVLWREHWLSQVRVAELDVVANAYSLGCGDYYLVVSVVVEGRSDSEPVTGAEVP